MIQACSHCGKAGEAPPENRVPFSAAARQKVLDSVCAACWKQWEDIEVRVINEYRLSLVDPEHRAALERACLEYLNLPA